MDITKIIGRGHTLFSADIAANAQAINDGIEGSRVLVIGGAGSIGREVAALIFARFPSVLHVIDVSENSLVELVRNIRSSRGLTDCETRFLPLDIGSIEARAFLAQQQYDYVLNFSAMKHVRSEKDEFSLMRMIKVNIVDTLDTLVWSAATGARKYFAVSTDKAQDPANLMGATKRIMEDVLFGHSSQLSVSTARFANVAFSDGSLLHGFRQRIMLRQPLSAPSDIKRYFVTGEEAGMLCLASIVLGGNREIFFPKLDPDQDLLSFSDIAVRFLETQGYTPAVVDSEDEARGRAEELINARKWPCYFFESDTSGEKPFEEFHSDADAVDWTRFIDIGVIARETFSGNDTSRVEHFLAEVRRLRALGEWDKPTLTDLIKRACPGLAHIETGKILDNRM